MTKSDYDNAIFRLADRKGIITSGLKAVSRNRQNVLKPIDFVATLLEGEVRYQKLPDSDG